MNSLLLLILIFPKISAITLYDKIFIVLDGLAGQGALVGHRGGPGGLCRQVYREPGSCLGLNLGTITQSSAISLYHKLSTMAKCFHI